MVGMNFHPLIVHFPVALLTVYCFFEIIRFKKVLASQIFFYIKAVFAILGSLSLLPTYLSGEVIEREFEDVHRIVEVHSAFAKSAIGIFGLIAFFYLVGLVGKNQVIINKLGNRATLVLKITKMVDDVIFRKHIIVIFAVIGFFIMMMLGALGGIIAHGQDIDPFTSIVYKLLFGS